MSQVNKSIITLKERRTLFLPSRYLHIKRDKMSAKSILILML